MIYYLYQLVMESLSLKSRLLAPMEMPVSPLGICQLCETTSQIEKSYLESLKLTVVDWPGARNTLSNPFRLKGADLADAGGDKYN